MNGEDICRVCLDEDIYVDWNNFLPEQSDLTYKDSYYSLTKLEPCNDFSTVLCRNCINCLENINIFIAKAIETHNHLLYLKNLDQNANKQNNNLEVVLEEDTDGFQQQLEQSIENFEGYSENCIIIENDTSIESLSTTECTQILKDEKKVDKTRSSQLPKVQPLVERKKRKKKKPQIEIPTCCSICSKVLASKYGAIRHEKTHRKNRERNCACTECGLKFYNKSCLSSHMSIHTENREKPWQCEFCDKTFYHRGALNVHRRIHLGQMIKCTLCTKEYPRQVDLDKHMATHLAARIDGNLKTKKKIYVTCEYCGEKLRSVVYKSHIARHKNEPLFKCSICDREFFARHNIDTHLKYTHKKETGERPNFIIRIKGNQRCSNLYMQQNSRQVFIEE